MYNPVETPEEQPCINMMCRDYEGDYWLASTNYGVYHLMSGKYQNYSRRAGIDGKSVNAITKSGGRYYIGTDTGLVIANEQWTAMENDLTDTLKGKRVRGVTADASGRIWALSYGDTPVIVYDPQSDTYRIYGNDSALLSDKMRSAIELSDGSMALFGAGGINILRDGELAETYGKDNGLDVTSMLCMEELADGTLAAGSDGGGIYLIKDGKVTVIGTESGLLGEVVLRMRACRGGLLISAGQSLYYWENAPTGTLRRLEKFYIGAGSVLDMQINDDTAWILTGSGVTRADLDTLLSDESNSYKTYGKDSGLPGSIISNSWNDLTDGTLYICTSRGACSLDIDNFPLITAEPKAAINSVTAESESEGYNEYGPSADLTLPADCRRVTIDFAALTYAGSGGTVEYWLEGFDPTYFSAGADDPHEVSYTNLSGGDYVFHVAAVNTDGVRSQKDIELVIHKTKALHEHTFFWIVIALLLLAAGFAAFKVTMHYKLRAMNRRQQEYRSITDQSLQTIANTIDAKDKYTNGHSLRVAQYSRELAHRLGLSSEEQENIYYIALLHDIGKIGIPDSILNKPGRLTDEEAAVIRSHPTIGGEILKDFTALPGIADGAKYHHERLDGTGYNKGLTGDSIPLYARIIGVADAYDAMNTERVYRAPLPREQIIAQLKEGAGTQFDEKIVKAAIEIIQDLAKD